ncbi:SRPBCC family protein [Pseudoprimorskyibacter insulae]|uniref:Polyketide cyclase / dehydrase and lipid transport n=1 Tax=Pseudoprimorskyibacter insulae TaxID=1695997 RepID=A0A2R8AP70_9RHOB|nr:SRPBCC family protein [Pseudoprimorskyibacter insulae]SPF77866.1 hypothetical protein PRI8871_00453 [Pseudoprimorskyibacter insulae]
MRFSSKEDLDAPIDAVFKVLTDFETIERAAIRRGLDVRRTAGGGEPGAGTTWKIGYEWRGKKREGTLVLSAYEAPISMRFDADSDGLEVVANVELVSLSQAHTRMMFDATLKPTNLPARLLLQSLKLAKGTLDRRFAKRFAGFASRAEESAQDLA